MKKAIVSYGLAITSLQRIVRVYHALLRGNFQALHDELYSCGHENWEPMELPDWLLLEIDSNILIRAEQAVVARAMINPELGNGVLQLSMGKGKYNLIEWSLMYSPLTASQGKRRALSPWLKPF